MKNVYSTIPRPYNEPIKEYLLGSDERDLLKAKLGKQYNQEIEIPLIIGGKKVYTDHTAKVICLHEHQHVIAVSHQDSAKETDLAVRAAKEGKQTWANLDWSHLSFIFVKMADLISTRYRYILNAATMLGQSKSLPAAAAITSRDILSNPR